MSPHGAETDATRCDPLTGRHLQVAAILGHEVHGGRVRLTVTQERQIGELVAWGGRLASALSAPLTASEGVSGVPGGLQGGFRAYSGAEGVAEREVA
jgi:hypothetical protein